jgi:hypothetical protein
MRERASHTQRHARSGIVLPLRLLRSVRFETISNVVAQPRSKSPSFSTNVSTAHGGQYNPRTQDPRRAGNRVRITAQLIDAANGAHLWADRYDRDLTDIFAVQDDVTRRIVDALKVTLSPAHSKRAPSVANFSQYNLVLGTAAEEMGDWFLGTRQLVRSTIPLSRDPRQSLFMRALELVALSTVRTSHGSWDSEPVSRERTRLTDSGTPNIDAYDCYLRGRRSELFASLRSSKHGV